MGTWLMTHEESGLSDPVRHYIIMELRGNLSKEARVASLGQFFDASFKRLGAPRSKVEPLSPEVCGLM